MYFIGMTSRMARGSANQRLPVERHAVVSRGARRGHESGGRRDITRTDSHGLDLEITLVYS